MLAPHVILKKIVFGADGMLGPIRILGVRGLICVSACVNWILSWKSMHSMSSRTDFIRNFQNLKFLILIIFYEKFSSGQRFTFTRSKKARHMYLYLKVGHTGQFWHFFLFYLVTSSKFVRVSVYVYQHGVDLSKKAYSISWLTFPFPCF